MTPIFFDSHVCQLPSTADLIGQELDFECGWGRRWRLEHYFGKDDPPGALLGLALRGGQLVMLAVSPLFIAIFMFALFLLAGGWALFRPLRR